MTSFSHKFIKWVKTLPLTFKKAEKVKVAGSAMKGQNVCFTGFRNEALEKAIDKTRKNMEKSASELDFPEAARLRDEIAALQSLLKNKF